MPAAERETAQSVDRALQALAQLGASRDGQTVTELAEALGTSRPSVYRLLAALERHGLARRGADGRARLGLGLLGLAGQVEPTLVQAATPCLRRLAEDTGATAHLSIGDGEDARAVAVVEPSWTDVHVAYRVGARHRLTQGAAGLAILGQREGHVPPGGWFFSEGQLQLGAQGVAAPVPGVAPLEASVGVVCLGSLDTQTIGPRVTRAAAEIGALLLDGGTR